MNISYRWLRTIAPTIQGAPRQLADRLGMLGAPVDELVDLGAGLEGIVIARVTDVREHPNADRLRLCTVEAGGGALQVVCGAPNVEAGGFYPFAPVGAVMPGGMQIRKAKLRGEESEGMLCSAKELGLGRDHAGLLRLEGEWMPGASFLNELELDDARLVLDVTPNRPELLSHLGVARELAPGGDADLRLTPFSSPPPDLEVLTGRSEATTAGVRVTIGDADGCSRYMAAVIEGVEVRPSPEPIATRLRAIGVRPINNIVDATNYVLHELGQPLHAFDLDRLAGPEVRVRAALPGESIRTLDGSEHALAGGELVIADAEVPIALAGVMGGEETEVTETTSRILLECALFDPGRVRMSARAFGLSTDASHRFERGVDVDGQPRALHRLVDLILAVAGGSLAEPAIDLQRREATPVEVRVRTSRVYQLLGVGVGAEEIADLLRPIGFTAEPAAEDLRVRVPPFRPDVTREVDVIEEIARRRGYDSFEGDLRHSRPGRVPEDPLLPLQGRLQGMLAGWGFLEARTAAFSPASDERVPLLNPLSAEESHLRDELLPGLLRRVEHNWSHGVRAIRLYEVGTVFSPGRGGGAAGEEMRLAGVLTGPSRPPHWSGQATAWDVWDLKALMEEGARLIGGSVVVDESLPGGDQFEPSGRIGLLAEDCTRLGHGGQVRSDHLDTPAWAEAVWGFEFRLEARSGRPPIVYDAIPAFPAVERDLALLVPADMKAARVEELVRSRGGELLAAVGVFDLYTGGGIPEGTRSIAWRLHFRHPERTLTDAEIDAVISEILDALREELGVQRR